MKNRNVLLSLILFFLPVVSYGGAVVTYHGRILDAEDKPVEASRVVFKVRIFSPNPGKCLLYEETREVSMVNSNGIFVIPIGDGGGTRTPGVDPGISIEAVFSNNPQLTLNRTGYPVFTCNSGGHSYTPQALDQRQLQVSFDDQTSAGEQILPVTDIGFVPLAVNSYDTQNIGGTPASSVLRVSGGTATALTPADFTELTKLLNGTTTQYAKTGQINGSSVPALSNGQVLGWSGGAWSAVTPLTSESAVAASEDVFPVLRFLPSRARTRWLAMEVSFLKWSQVKEGLLRSPSPPMAQIITMSPAVADPVEREELEAEPRRDRGEPTQRVE